MCDPSCIAHRGDVLRYYGTGLQAAGILAAALGIRAVRREWTRNPGLIGTVTAGAHAASWWIAERLASTSRSIALRVMRRRIRGPYQHRGAFDTALATDAVVGREVIYAPPAENATCEVKIDWLIERVINLRTTTVALAQQLDTERAAREAAVTDTVSALTSTERGLRDRLADLAGGGLRLQAWGLCALLVGITLAALPDKLAAIG